jgi:murein DD-endopeptidase MepM/ murein hydrolase activator NlpD
MAAGVVAYAGPRSKGEGNLILIRHADGFVSAYAGDLDLRVKRDDLVKAGQEIGIAGVADGETALKLRFELRKKGQPVDLLAYLGCR